MTYGIIIEDVETFAYDYEVYPTKEELIDYISNSVEIPTK